MDIIARSDKLGIDRRQRVAAALLLVGFDLPAEMAAAAEQMIEAAQVCPGITMDELVAMEDGARRSALEAARALIDTMLNEIAVSGKIAQLADTER